MGELGLDGAMSPWFPLVMILHLPFAIWLSLVLLFLLSLIVAYLSCKLVNLYSWETCSLWKEFRYGEL